MLPSTDAIVTHPGVPEGAQKRKHYSLALASSTEAAMAVHRAHGLPWESSLLHFCLSLDSPGDQMPGLFFPGSPSLSSPPISSGDPHLDQTNTQTPKQSPPPKIACQESKFYALPFMQRDVYKNVPSLLSGSHMVSSFYSTTNQKKKKNTGGPEKHCTPDGLQDPNSKAS